MCDYLFDKEIERIQKTVLAQTELKDGKTVEVLPWKDAKICFCSHVGLKQLNEFLLKWWDTLFLVGTKKSKPSKQEVSALENAYNDFYNAVVACFGEKDGYETLRKKRYDDILAFAIIAFEKAKFFEK